ncbi:hypothetical protein [Streptomyces platensis]|uniref:hypothetical protein n=1 Tax=Streptomyces platensis TaxID=58346 RepID=UPI00378F12C6
MVDRLPADSWTGRTLTRDPTHTGARSLADTHADVRAVDMAEPAALKPAIDGT